MLYVCGVVQKRYDWVVNIALIQLFKKSYLLWNHRANHLYFFLIMHRWISGRMLTYRTSIKVCKKYKSMSHNFTDWSKGPTESFWPLSIWILSALLTIHMPLGLYFQYFGGRRWFTCFVRFLLADYYGDLQFWNHMLFFLNFYFFLLKNWWMFSYIHLL